MQAWKWPQRSRCLPHLFHAESKMRARKRERDGYFCKLELPLSLHVAVQSIEKYPPRHRTHSQHHHAMLSPVQSHTADVHAVPAYLLSRNVGLPRAMLQLAFTGVGSENRPAGKMWRHSHISHSLTRSSGSATSHSKISYTLGDFDIYLLFIRFIGGEDASSLSLLLRRKLLAGCGFVAGDLALATSLISTRY